mmetsp:Transcript_81509/g.143944  ORF Transcript_81509/g.143944 Transcript_81509/m.143944 type:complete len:299 (+) Transcript_81509:1-897(+)
MGMMTGQMGLPPGAPTSAAAGGEKSKKKSVQLKKAKDESDEEEGDDVEDGAEESEEEEESRSSGRRRRRGGERRDRNRGRRERSRKRDRTPERIPEVERFIDENRINKEAADKMRTLSPESQRRVIARPLTGDVQNPSKVMIARVRELISQNEKAKSSSSKQPDPYAMWGGAMLGATPEAIQKYIDDNDLDDSASRSLRALAPHHQATAIRWDLSKYRNASSKFMSMAADLAKSPAPPPSMPMTPAMYGMPPPGGIPAMYGMPMPGMHPGMMPPPMSMYSMPPPGMAPPPMMGLPPQK